MTTQQTDKTTATPRTDAFDKSLDHLSDSMAYWKAINFARQLETELTTATAARLDAERKVAEMRAVLEAAQTALYGSHYGNGPLLDSIAKALSTTLGQGWMSPEEVKELLKSERDLSNAYIRLRTILNAFDTPHAPSAEQVWEHTEKVANELKAKLSELEREVERLKRIIPERLQRALENQSKSSAAQWLDDQLNSAAQKQLDALREKCARLEDALKIYKTRCPNCGGVGWYAKQSLMDSQPEQVQCDWCYDAEQALSGSAGGEVYDNPENYEASIPASMQKSILPATIRERAENTDTPSVD
jgi:hypothetical protein